MISLSSTRRMTAVALLSAVGVALFVVESYIPMPLPFLKLGLANISSVIALMILGPTAMISVVVFRVTVGSLLVGTFLSPAFVLASSAGILSAGAMALTKITTRDIFSALGISVVGSVVHVVVQLLVVRFVYVQNAAVLNIFPLLLLTALAGGLVVGWVSLRLLITLSKIRI